MHIFKRILYALNAHQSAAARPCVVAAHKVQPNQSPLVQAALYSCSIAAQCAFSARMDTAGERKPTARPCGRRMKSSRLICRL
jgi:hypothetical protein